MADDISSPLRMQKKTRSASICATGGSIETVIYNMPSGNNTPDSQGTPNYRRRRPATRSQSARITATAGRSVSYLVVYFKIEFILFIKNFNYNMFT